MNMFGKYLTFLIIFTNLFFISAVQAEEHVDFNFGKNIGQNIISKLDVHKIDLIKPQIMNEKIKKIKPDVVYHLASYGVYYDQTRNSKIINTNILGTLNLFNAILEYADVKKIVNMGTCLEYGSKIKKKMKILI